MNNGLYNGLDDGLVNGLYNGSLNGINNGLTHEKSNASTILQKMNFAFDFNLNGLDSVGQHSAGIISNIIYGEAINKNYANFYTTNSYYNWSAISVGTNFSVSFWINPSLSTSFLSTYSSILTDFGGTTGIFYKRASQGLIWYNGGDRTLTLSDSVPRGSWSFITVVKTGTTVKTYINGKLQFNNTGINTFTATRTGNDNAGEYFMGGLNMMYGWDYSLTAEEVLMLYNGGKGLPLPFRRN